MPEKSKTVKSRSVKSESSTHSTSKHLAAGGCPSQRPVSISCALQALNLKFEQLWVESSAALEPGNMWTMVLSPISDPVICSCYPMLQRSYPHVMLTSPPSTVRFSFPWTCVRAADQMGKLRWQKSSCPLVTLGVPVSLPLEKHKE